MQRNILYGAAATRRGIKDYGEGSRGVFAGGSASNVIEYITISTAGNSTDFGDLTTSRDYMGGLAGD